MKNTYKNRSNRAPLMILAALLLSTSPATAQDFPVYSVGSGFIAQDPAGVTVYAEANTTGPIITQNVNSDLSLSDPVVISPESEADAASSGGEELLAVGAAAQPYAAGGDCRSTGCRAPQRCVRTTLLGGGNYQCRVPGQSTVPIGPINTIPVNPQGPRR